MAPDSEIARRYFEALSGHDLDAALACWAPGAVDRLVGGEELPAPEGIRRYFTDLFAAFPDFRLEIVDCTSSEGRTAVRWRATGTFAGPGAFQGFQPNSARISIEGCDVVSVAGELITGNDAYLDSGDIARQLGFLPPVGSTAEARLARVANARTGFHDWLHGAEPEAIAEGVWIVRGGRPRTMNVYLIQDEGGLTMFDAGISDMADGVRAVAARLGGVKRIVLGHADCDHRGAAPSLEAPVYCHPAEVQAAQSESALRPYWDLRRLAAPLRPIYPKLLESWDGGAVEIAGTLQEGDEVAGFRVIELPGHAPGLIGLFRDADRLAFVSDAFYTLNPQTGRGNAAHVPHPAFNQDTEQARASIRTLAHLDPLEAWAGHAKPVTGEVARALERAASSPA